VLRGGSWNDGASALRSAYRDYYNPSNPSSLPQHGSIGFRVVVPAQ
jgi:formylglycine-generating enzyme required for sulfatase activity